MVTLKIEGKLLAPWLTEVRSMLNDVRQGRAQRLNLSDVAFIDAESARFLAALRRTGLELTGCSPFIASLIDLCDHR